MYVSVCLGAQSSQFVSINQAKQEKSENLFREKGKFNNLPKNRDYLSIYPLYIILNICSHLDVYGPDRTGQGRRRTWNQWMQM